MPASAHAMPRAVNQSVAGRSNQRVAGASSDTHDDELIATMVALWCAYEGEYDDTRGFIPINREPNEKNSEFKFFCQTCGNVWHGDRGLIPEEGDFSIQLRCPKPTCRSIRVSFAANKETRIIDPREDFNGDLRNQLWGKEDGARDAKELQFWEL